jgi:hypothetical protein
VFVVVGRDGQHALAVAWLAPSSRWPPLGQQPGNRLLVSGNDQFRARTETFDQVRQSSLGFFKRYRGHVRFFLFRAMRNVDPNGAAPRRASNLLYCCPGLAPCHNSSFPASNIAQAISIWISVSLRPMDLKVSSEITSGMSALLGERRSSGVSGLSTFQF